MADSKFEFQYVVENPTLDARRNRGILPVGGLSRVFGVDGRYANELRRMPGTIRLGKIVDGTTTYSAPQFFQGITLQKGATSYILRGYLVAATPSTAAQVDLIFYYYDTQTSAYAVYTIASNIGASPIISACTNGRYCYIAIEGTATKTFYWGTSTFLVKTFGVGDFARPALVASTDATVNATGGVLENGKYLLAYRYFDPTRNLYSGLSEIIEVPVTVGTSGVQYIALTRTETHTGVGATNIQDYTKVEVYRSISVSVGGSAYAGSYLYKVGTKALTVGATTSSWTYNVGKTDEDGLSDILLVQQDGINPADEVGGAAPASGTIGTHEGVTFMASVGGSGTTDVIGNFVWSPTQTNSPENFPIGNMFTGKAADSPIQAFIPSSDYLYAFTPKQIYRIKRVGATLNIFEVYVNRGISGRLACDAVDNALIFASQAGLMLLNSSTGRLTQVSAVNKYFTEEWASSLSSLEIKYDATLGAVLVFNPTTEESLLLWSSTNYITHVADLTWKHITASQLPTAGGVNRVFGITNNCTIFYIDADRTSAKQTMAGTTGTVNGTLTGSGTGTLTDSTASFQTTLGGLTDMYVYMLSGASIGLKRKITTNTATQLTYAGAALTVAAGDRYAIAPVYFEVRYWPLTIATETEQPRQLFRRWAITAMGVCVNYLAGEATTAIQKIFVGAYRNFGTAFENILNEAPLMSDNPADSRVYFNVDGVVLEPGLKQIAADVDFSIAASLVAVKFTASKNAN